MESIVVRRDETGIRKQEGKGIKVGQGVTEEGKDGANKSKIG